MSQASIWRHKNSCVIAKPFKGMTPIPEGVRFDTLGMLMRVLNELGEASRLAQQDGDVNNWVRAQGRIAEVTLELHKLQPKEEKAVYLHRSTQFAELRASLIVALTPFPDALAAVTRALSLLPRGDS
jgi:hypothetical protein